LLKPTAVNKELACFGFFANMTKKKENPITIKETKVYLKRKVPFSWNKNEIIYLGHPLSTFVNQFIRENFLHIKKSFAKHKSDLHSYDFVYIPHLVDPDIISYNYPFLSEEQIRETKINIAATQSLITRHIHGRIKYPCFIRRDRGNAELRLFCYSFDSKTPLSEQIANYIEMISYSDAMFSSIIFETDNEPVDKNQADKDFEKNTRQLIHEIKERVSLLRQMGISEYVLEQIVLHPQPILSRIVITVDYRILLPDYNNTEIRMHPLPKTVYFFFLKHSEGIRFKDLSDHHQELLSIYKRLTNKESQEEIYRSIDAITDSTRNSINEKCSRIKEAFYTAFTPSIADQYIITGTSSTPKSIKLERDLVIWEADL